MYRVLIVSHSDNYAEAQQIATLIRSQNVFNPLLLHVAISEMDVVSIKSLVDGCCAVLVLDNDLLYSDMITLAVIARSQNTIGKLGFISTNSLFSQAIIDGRFAGSTLDCNKLNFTQSLELFLLISIHS